MLTGFRPYSGTDARSVLYQQLRMGPNLSPLAPSDRPIVRRALASDPESRFGSCRELIAALKAADGFQALPPKAMPPQGGVLGWHSELGRPALESHPVRRGDKTTAVTTKAKTVPLQATVRRTPNAGDDEAARVQFVAFLPLEIFAAKLRGFMDDLGAEVALATPDRTVVRIQPKGLFGGRKAVFLQIDTTVKNPASGYRVVEAAAWTRDQHLDRDEWRCRAAVLFRYLKAHFMAMEREPLWGTMTSDAVRAAVLHGN
jgi:hypothetical protein